jgi:hypothetical protein
MSPAHAGLSAEMIRGKVGFYRCCGDAQGLPCIYYFFLGSKALPNTSCTSFQPFLPQQLP